LPAVHCPLQLLRTMCTSSSTNSSFMSSLGPGKGKRALVYCHGTSVIEISALVEPLLASRSLLLLHCASPPPPPPPGSRCCPPAAVLLLLSSCCCPPAATTGWVLQGCCSGGGSWERLPVSYLSRGRHLSRLPRL
jgi:hypothetical protein